MHRPTSPAAPSPASTPTLTRPSPFVDLRHAVRSFAQHPAFALLAVSTLALGIGVNTAIFSAMHAVLLRYLPVPEPERVVHLRTSGLPSTVSQTGNIESSFSGHTWERLRTAQLRTVRDVVAHVPLSYDGQVAVRRGDVPETAAVVLVSGNFFPGLQVGAHRGRTLLPEDEGTATAVLGHSWWMRRFRGDPDVVGDVVHVKGVPFTVVGIAAKGFGGLDPAASTDLWIPLQTRPDLGPWGHAVRGETFVLETPDWWFLRLAARLAPGVSHEEALAELRPIFRSSSYPDSGPPEGEQVPELSFDSVRGAQSWSEAIEHPLAQLMGMVALVLVIACTNVVMLILARNSARRAEISLRVALGAGRRDLFRQLLAEGLLLAAAGGALGAALALGATRVLGAWARLEQPLTPDASVLAFTVAVSSAAALVFGLIPLRSVATVSASEVLRSTSRSIRGAGGRPWRSRLVLGLQMALCLALLVGAGLLVGSLRNLQDADLGLEAAGLVVFGVHPDGPTDVEARRFHDDLLREVRALPGVRGATVMSNRIGSGWSNNTSAIVDGSPATDASGRSVLRWNVVGPAYFETLRIPLLRGRDLRDGDTAEAPLVAVVNETFATTYLPGGDAIGHTVHLDEGAPGFTIVGVARDSRYTGVRETPRPMAYLPYAQLPGVRLLHVAVRADRAPGDLLAELRSVVARLDPELPLLDPGTQAAEFESSYSDARLLSRLSIVFGVLAAVLVAVGLYGTLSHRVSRRRAEIGVRMALGAPRGRILGMILLDGLGTALVGLALGIPLAVAGARLLRAQLFGLGPSDPFAWSGAVVGLVVVALLAGLVPARRAAGVDPWTVIRTD